MCKLGIREAVVVDRRSHKQYFYRLRFASTLSTHQELLMAEISFVNLPSDDNRWTLLMKSILGQVIEGSRYATHHYRSQNWPRPLLPYGLTMSHLLKSFKCVVGVISYAVFCDLCMSRVMNALSVVTYDMLQISLKTITYIRGTIMYCCLLISLLPLQNICLGSNRWIMHNVPMIYNLAASIPNKLNQWCGFVHDVHCILGSINLLTMPWYRFYLPVTFVCWI